LALCEQQKGTLRECIAARRTQIAELKARRKALPKHILIKDLPEEDRFYQCPRPTTPGHYEAHERKLPESLL
jgi:hypothetical protein